MKLLSLPKETKLMNSKEFYGEHLLEDVILCRY